MLSVEEAKKDRVCQAVIESLRKNAGKDRYINGILVNPDRRTFNALHDDGNAQNPVGGNRTTSTSRKFTKALSMLLLCLQSSGVRMSDCLEIILGLETERQQFQMLWWMSKQVWELKHYPEPEETMAAYKKALKLKLDDPDVSSIPEADV